MAFSVLTVVSALSLVVVGDKYRELQFLYAATEDRIHYVFIPDPRNWAERVLPHLRSKGLIRSEYSVEGVKFLQANSYIVKVDDNIDPVDGATILRVDQHGFTEEFVGSVGQGDDGRCFADVRTSTPKVMSLPGRSDAVSPLLFTMEEARVEVLSELWSVCRDGLTPIRPQRGDQDRIIGTYSGAYKGKFSMQLTLSRDAPPDLRIQECEPGELGLLRKVVYHNICNFLIVNPVFRKSGRSYYFRVVLTPSLPGPPAGTVCNEEVRSYDLVKLERSRSRPPAQPSCHFNSDSEVGKFHSSNIMRWDSIFKPGFTVRSRGVTVRSRLTEATFTS
ncbi:hypothetical protein FOZ61_009459 [Perkinsus olseni]|uniref:Uncharacterized protein n=1 Tax=Perkinsus olseni TaxID=32597 RepID=A0A7J6KZV0_PEROL|nr:hypothetical protein FOZ61_009459 [Perkinsus olseni]KAF4660580.1 hypothetical protein FOL46_006090 [Perkinsus olseni]